MDTKKVRLGSISILLTVILLCVTVLAVLSLTTARADAVLANRYAAATTDYYELQNEGQAFLAEVRNLNTSIQEAGIQGESAQQVLEDAIANLESLGAEAEEGSGLTILIRKEEEQSFSVVIQKEGEQSFSAELTLRLELQENHLKVTTYRTDILWEEDTQIDVLP